MNHSPTIKDIITSFIKEAIQAHDGRPVIIATHVIENRIPEYGKRTFGQCHTPASYSRRWRELIREQFRGRGLVAAEIPDRNSVEKKWAVHYS